MLRAVYVKRYSTSMGKAVLDDLSFHGKTALATAMLGQRTARCADEYDLAEARCRSASSVSGLITRLHWNRSRMEAVKTAYQTIYGKTIADRVKGDTSGDYRSALLAMLAR